MARQTGGCRAAVAFPAPVDIASSLSFLKRSGDDYLDRWDGESWVRTLANGTRHVPFACRPLGSVEAPRLEVRVATPENLAAARDAARASFVLPGRGFTALLKRDPVLARLNRRFPGIRQVRQFDFLYGLLRCVSSQQITLRWAVTLRRRLAEAYGEKLRVGSEWVYALRPEVLAAASVADLRSLRFSTHKAESVIAVAEALASRRLVPEELARMSDAVAMQRLVALRGIGTWSAEWILVRCLGRERVVAGDLGVRKAVAIAYLGKDTATEIEVRQAVSHWGAHATTAQALLLHAYVVKALDEA